MDKATLILHICKRWISMCPKNIEIPANLPRDLKNSTSFKKSPRSILINLYKMSAIEFIKAITMVVFSDSTLARYKKIFRDVSVFYLNKNTPNMKKKLSDLDNCITLKNKLIEQLESNVIIEKKQHDHIEKKIASKKKEFDEICKNIINEKMKLYEAKKLLNSIKAESSRVCKQVEVHKKSRQKLVDDIESLKNEFANYRGAQKKQTKTSGRY